MISCVAPSPTLLLWSQGSCVESLSRPVSPGPVRLVLMDPGPFLKPHPSGFCCVRAFFRNRGYLSPRGRTRTGAHLGTRVLLRTYTSGEAAHTRHSHPLLCVAGRRGCLFGPASPQAPRAPGFLNVWFNIQMVYGLFMEIKAGCSFNRLVNAWRPGSRARTPAWVSALCHESSAGAVCLGSDPRTRPACSSPPPLLWLSGGGQVPGQLNVSLHGQLNCHCAVEPV